MISRIIRIILITILKGIVRKYTERNQNKKEEFNEVEELKYEELNDIEEIKDEELNDIEERRKSSTIHYRRKVEQLRQDIELGKVKDLKKKEQ